MPTTELSIEQPKIFGVTDSAITLAFTVHDGDTPVDAEATVSIDGDVRAVSKGRRATTPADKLCPTVPESS